MTRITVPLLAVAVSLSLTACAREGMSVAATVPPRVHFQTYEQIAAYLEKHPGGRALDVPFIEQQAYQCGPAAVAMALSYHGIEVDPERIAERFATQAVAGTFTVDLLIAASEHAEAHWVDGSLSSLKAEIDQARPALVFVNQLPNPLPARHFAVAVGYLEVGGVPHLALHSGQTPYLLVPESAFAAQWKRTGNMMMTVRPVRESA